MSIQGKMEIYNLAELDKDSKRKKVKYYKAELCKLGINFNMLSSKCQKEIINFFMEIKENLKSAEGVQEQLITLMKKADKKIFEKILKRTILLKYVISFQEELKVLIKNLNEEELNKIDDSKSKIDFQKELIKSIEKYSKKENKEILENIYSEQLKILKKDFYNKAFEEKLDSKGIQEKFKKILREELDKNINLEFLKKYQEKLIFSTEILDREKLEVNFINILKKSFEKTFNFYFTYFETSEIRLISQSFANEFETLNYLDMILKLNTLEIFCNLRNEFFHALKEKLEKSYYVESFSLIEEELIDNLTWSWKNIYFSSKVPEEERYSYYQSLKKILEEIKKNIIKQNLKNKGLDDYIDIIYSFAILKEMMIKKFEEEEIELECDYNIENLKKVFENLRVEYIRNMEFKDRKTKELKKDNEFKNRLEKIRKLISKLDSLNDGVIISDTKEFLELLYIFIYKSKIKIKIESVERPRMLSTLVDYVLSGKDLDGKIIKILNTYVKDVIFFIKGKDEELLYIKDLKSSLKELFEEINKGMNSKIIRNNLLLTIEEIVNYSLRKKF